jgi:hypothetical protein
MNARLRFNRKRTADQILPLDAIAAALVELTIGGNA